MQINSKQIARQDTGMDSLKKPGLVLGPSSRGHDFEGESAAAAGYE